MDNAALWAAVIAGIAAVVSVLWKGHQDRKLKILELAIQTAHKDFENTLSVINDQIKLDEKPARPYLMSAYIAFHYYFFTELDRCRSSTISLKSAFRGVNSMRSTYLKYQFSDYKDFWKIPEEPENVSK